MAKLQSVGEHTDRMSKVWENDNAMGFYDTVETLVASYMYCRNWTNGLVGESGIGKNAMVKKAADLLGIDVIMFNCLGKLSEDLAGPMYTRILNTDKKYTDMVDLTEDYYRTEQSYTYGIFEQIKKAFDPKWKGILFFDEAIKADRELRKRIYQFFHDREFDGKKLSPGAMIVCGFNPPQQSSYQLQNLDHAEEDRILYLAVGAKLGDFINYLDGTTDKKEAEIKSKIVKPFIENCKSNTDGEDRYTHSAISEYVRKKADFYNEFLSRRITHAKDVIVSLEKFYQNPITKVFCESHSDHIGTILLNGCLTPKYAHELIKYFKDSSKIDISAVLLGKKGAYDKFVTAVNDSNVFISMNLIITDLVSAVSNPREVLNVPKPESETHMKATQSIINNLYKILRFIVEEKGITDSAIEVLRQSIRNDALETEWPAFIDCINGLHETNPDFDRLIDKMYKTGGIEINTTVV